LLDQVMSHGAAGSNPTYFCHFFCQRVVRGQR
jgi:hypothetical protein